MKGAREAVLAAARIGLRAESAEAGLASIRRVTGTELSDSDIADAVAALVAECLIPDPVRLEAGALHCHWRLEMSPGACSAALESGR